MNLLEHCERFLGSDDSALRGVGYAAGNGESTFGRSGSAPESAEPGRAVSRRGLLTGGAVLGSLFGGAVAKAGPPKLSAKAPSPILRLIRRMTWGLTAEQVQLAAGMTPEEYIEYHLNYEAIDDSALDARLAVEFPTLSMGPNELYQLGAGEVVGELIGATILRSTVSKRQLFERMVGMWTDHFNIDITKGADQYLKTVDDREVVRAHALGRFTDLLTASAMSPAMLFYLDNFTSVADHPNENYSRELCELHTLGPNNGYNEQDVREIARCFTGWTITPPGRPGGGEFVFNSRVHDTGQKQVFGYTIPAGRGLQDGLDVIDLLTRSATHAPRCANFIAGKLCEWFYGYEPPATVVASVAETYLGTDGDIKAMVRTVLQHVTAGAPLKLKRPYHYVVSTMRAAEADLFSSRALIPTLRTAGQIPFYWSPPDGYPDDLDFWVGLMLPRWNFAFSLLNRELPGINVDLQGLLGDARSAQAIANRVDTKFFGGEMPVEEKDALVAYLLPNNPPVGKIRDGLGLAAAMPGFQWF